MLSTLLIAATGALAVLCAACLVAAEYLGRKYTVVYDVPALAHPRPAPARGKHAVVLGGGLAGIMAARVLLDHYDHVTIVEKDFYDWDSKRVRGAVPQGAHAHLLLAIGNATLQQLFPGIENEFQRRGGLVSDLGKAMRWFYWGSLRVRCEMNYPFWCASRPFVDRVVRDLFFQQFGDRVTLKQGRTIEAPVLSTDLPALYADKTSRVPITGQYANSDKIDGDEFRVVGVRIKRRAEKTGNSVSNVSSVSPNGNNNCSLDSALDAENTTIAKTKTDAKPESVANEHGYDGVVNDVDAATVTTALDARTAAAEAAEIAHSNAIIAPLLAKDADAAPEEFVLGDLVVDCSGTNPVSETWANRRWGLEIPSTVLKANAMYVSHLFEEPADVNPEWICAPVYPVPGSSSRFGYLMRIEHKRWQVTGMATAGTRVLAAEDEDSLPAFIEHFNKLDDDFIYKMLTTPSAVTGAPPRAVPGERLHIYKPPRYVRRHVERVAQWPEGLLVLGNAACVFDPVYGQGMSGAAIGALSLNKVLQQSRFASKAALTGNGFAAAYHALLADRLAFPWMLCVGEDRRWTGIEASGPAAGPHFLMRSLQFWIRQGMVLAELHPLAQRTAMGIMNMTVSFTSLLNPALVYLVFKNVASELLGLSPETTPEARFPEIEHRRQERIAEMQRKREEAVANECKLDALAAAAAKQ